MRHAVRMNRLVRPLRGRLLAGVCAAVAYRLGLSPLVVRLLWVLLSLIPGPLWIVYVALWVIIPSESR
jgi:phage shock protein C